MIDAVRLLNRETPYESNESCPIIVYVQGMYMVVACFVCQAQHEQQLR
jgi:hypothetical protein